VTLRARRVPRSAVGTLPGVRPVHGFPLADSEYGEFLEICVSDNGIGISKKNMARLFQPFSQIDSSLARKFEGTGLGLAMVKQMAELHGAPWPWPARRAKVRASPPGCRCARRAQPPPPRLTAPARRPWLQPVNATHCTGDRGRRPGG